MICMKRSSLKISTTVCLLVLVLVGCVKASVQFSQSGTVTVVYDGVSFGLSSGATVRLVSVDTAGVGQPGYNEAKNYLGALVQGKMVYLDVADTTSIGGKVTLVCLVYIDHNATCYENVNMAMLVSNYAFPNSTFWGEYSPSSWSLLNAKESPTASPAVPTPMPTVTPEVTASVAPSPPISTPGVPEIPFVAIFVVMLSAMFFVVYNKIKRKMWVESN